MANLKKLNKQISKLAMDSNTPPSTSLSQHKTDIAIPVAITLLLIATASYNYLLFHTLAEMLTVVVSITMAVVAWHTYSFTRNHFFTYLGIGYFWVACMDLLHTLSFKGLDMLGVNGAQTTLEFWIFARYFEALILLSAFFFFKHKLNRIYVTLGFGFYFILISTLVISGVLPKMFIEEEGLTPFKVNSEYIIIGILIAAWIVLYNKRNNLEKNILHLLLISIGFTIAAEFCFTSYITLYGNFHLTGHIAKFFSFWCIYLAIIRTTLSKPYQAMARGASTYNAIALPTLLIDRKGIIHQANQAAQRFTQLTENELLNHHCHDLFHSKQCSHTNCPICHHIQQNRPLDGFELEFLHAKWQKFTLSPIGPMGDMEGLVQVSEDITKRKHAEQALQTSELYNRMLFNQSPIGLALCRMNGELVDINATYAQIIGYPIDKALQLSYWDITPTKYTEDEQHQVKTLKITGHYGPYEKEYIHKNGHLIPVRLSGKLLEKDGETFILSGVEDITEQKKTEEALRESDANLIKGQEIAHIGNWKLDPETGKLTSSDELLRILGLTINEIGFDAFVKTIHPEDREATLTFIQEGIEEEAPWEIEHRLQLKDGTEKWVHTAGEPKLDENGKTTHVIGIVQDITDRKLIDKILRRTQKMDAIGQLTGGIAHDFNNLLGIIIGNLGLLKHQEPVDKTSGKYINTANKAALRAAKLTKQLLGFSRRQAQNIALTNINNIIQDMDSLIIRSVTPQVEVVYLLAEDLWLTNIDPGDFEDALLNLALNARDAMPEGGKLTIETSNQTLEQAYTNKTSHIIAGEYVVIAISDTGTGMTTEVQEHIFDPFFTTKPQGKGTGLGMSMVFGFISRSKGQIIIYSEPKIGTTLRLYLPRAHEEKADPLQLNNQTESKAPRGHETILIVDDEEDLLELAQDYLAELGYQIVTATNGPQALDQLTKVKNIDLLFSDVVMPGGMNGYELAEQAIAKYPKLKVLLTSGFTSTAIAKNGQAHFEAHLLPKPYQVKELAKQIRARLDSD